ncbi:hypothetical protein BC937DRAFT_94438 [Endogone sp. FLAS-F59071]|nr:hypothetical protein BC937DRAFT_94438 [Endogone sp. FLAS-F59071]|eukprot:RUS14037.1 hypothetical protein BC937DRAFT_94438 [Endogone sp. FLAS-F59071]
MEEPVMMCRVRWSELSFFFFLLVLFVVRFAEKKKKNNKTFRQSLVLLYNILFLAHANHLPSYILFVGEAWKDGQGYWRMVRWGPDLWCWCGNL